MAVFIRMLWFLTECFKDRVLKTSADCRRSWYKGKGVLMCMTKGHMFSPTAAATTRTTNPPDIFKLPFLLLRDRRSYIYKCYRLHRGSTCSGWLDCWTLGCCPTDCISSSLAFWHHGSFEGRAMPTSGWCSRLTAGYGLEENDHAVSLQGSFMQCPSFQMAGSGVCSALRPCEMVHGGALSMRVRTCLPSFFFAFVFSFLSSLGWCKAQTCGSSLEKIMCLFTSAASNEQKETPCSSDALGGDRTGCDTLICIIDPSDFPAALVT